MWNPEAIGIGIQNTETWNPEYNTAMGVFTWGELVTYYRHRIEKKN